MEMNNEPVAWINRKGEFMPEKADSFDIPLYTHPVKEQDTDCQYCKQGCIRCDARKQLTDEEIGQLKGEWYRGNYASFYDLVRAILRKAQEK